MSLFPEYNIYGPDSLGRDVQRLIESEGDPESIARRQLTLPDLRSEREVAAFRLNYGEVHTKPGNRYNILGQKLYDPLPTAVEGRLATGNLQANITQDRTIQLRGLEVINTLNSGLGGTAAPALSNSQGSMANRFTKTTVFDSLVSPSDTNILRGLVSSPVFEESVTVRPTTQDISSQLVFPAQQRTSYSSHLGAFAHKNVNEQGVQDLYSSVVSLQNSLGNAITSIERQYAQQMVNGRIERVLVGIRVGIRNYNDLYDGLGLYSQSSYPGVQRAHYFNFTVNRNNQVIETSTNRLITGSLISQNSGHISNMGGRNSAYNTVLGLLSSYARSAEIEAKYGVTHSLFNVMVARQDYSSLGRVFAEMLIQRDQTTIVNQGNRFREILELLLSTTNNKGLSSIVENTVDRIARQGLDYYATIGALLDKEVLEQQINKLYSYRKQQLLKAFEPITSHVGGINETFGLAIDTTLRNLNELVANDAEQFSIPINGRRVTIAGFEDLKMAALSVSPSEHAHYDFRKNQASSSILQLLMSPFLMPHETGFSGSQAAARLGFYHMVETRGGRSMYEIYPAVYRHGFGGTKPGEYIKLISAQSAKSSLFKYTSNLYNFTGAKKVVEFFETRTVFEGMPALRYSSLKEVKEHLQSINYTNADEIIKNYKTRMHLGADEEDDTEILLLPFRKAEQISQRLKNLLGGRPMLELNTNLRQAILKQDKQALLNLFERSEFGDLYLSANALAGEIPANLNKIQYDRLILERNRIIKRLGYEGRALSDSERLTLSTELVKAMRAAELDIFDGGGFVQGRRTRRVAVAMGINTLSDFMLVNNDYLQASSFGYMHVSNQKIAITHTLKTDKVGTIRQPDPLFDAKVNFIASAFRPGTIVYLQPKALENEKVKDSISRLAAKLRSEYLAKNLDSRYLDAQVTQALLQSFPALDSVSFTDGELTTVMLKAGAYQFTNDSINFLGALEGSRIRLGLMNKGGRFNLTSAPSSEPGTEFFEIKVPGEVRKYTGGMLAVAGPTKAKPGQGGGLELEIPWLIETGIGGTSRSSSLTKGPWLMYDGAGFEAFGTAFKANSMLSHLQNDSIFAVMNPGVFKAYNYESGLSILRDTASRQSLLNLSSGDLSLILGVAFLQKNADTRLRQALVNYLDSNSSSLAVSPYLRTLIQDKSFGSSAAKLENLLLTAPDLATLVDSPTLRDFGDRLAEQFENGTFEIQSRLEAIVNRALKGSTTIYEQIEGDARGIRTFDERNFSVRSAGILADIIYTTQQTIDPSRTLGRITGGKPLTGLNFIDDQGRPNVRKFIDNRDFRAASLDMAQKLRVRSLLPNQSILESSLSQLREGDALYKDIENLLYVIHSSLMASPYIERAINLLPSRVLYPAGSEDAVGLEYHYSLSLSKKEFAALRGQGLDMERFTQAQAAYSTVVTHSGVNEISRRMEIISPFGVDPAQRNLGRIVSALIQDYNEISGKAQFIGNDNLSPLDAIVRSISAGDEAELNSLMARYQLINQAVRYHRGVGPSDQQSTVNLITALNPSRLDLSQATDEQIRTLGALYNLRGDVTTIRQGLSELGPTLGRGLLYLDRSDNLFSERRLALSKAIITYSELRRNKGLTDLSYNLSPYDADVQSALVTSNVNSYNIGFLEFEQALNLVTDQSSGRLDVRYADNRSTKILNVASKLQANDAFVERLALNAAGTSTTDTFINSLQRIVASTENILKFYGKETEQAQRALKLRSEVYDTKTLLLPAIETYTAGDGTIIKLAESDSNGKVQYTDTPVLQLGLDVLSQIPTRFESYINEVVERQQRIRELIPKFQEVVNQLQKGFISNASVSDISIIEEMQRLAYESQHDLESILTSVLQQNAENEKRKYPGVAFTAVADYLATPTEAFVGKRVTSTGLNQVVRDAKATLNSPELSTKVEVEALQRIGQLTGYVNRAGGLSGASQSTNMLHDVKSQAILKERGQLENNQLQLSLQGNETALIVSMYGRFGVHGGDFDGDSYQLIFGFRDIQESLVKAIQHRDAIRNSLLNLQSQSTLNSEYNATIQGKISNLQTALTASQQDVDRLITEVDNLSTITADRVKEGMRRHVAAFTGIPLSLALKPEYYSDEEIAYMIEQQRGVTPGLTDAGEKYGDQITKFTQLFNKLNPTTLASASDKFIDSEASRLKFSAEELSLFKEFARQDNLYADNLTASDRNRLFTESITSYFNLHMGLSEGNKFAQAAAGSVLDLGTFEVLQTVVGNVGTSLIGEGYNAITTLIGRSVLARTMGQALNDPTTNIGEGIVQALDTLNTNNNNLDDNVTRLKDLFSEGRLKQTAAFAESRAQQLQMNLGLIQQIIRDSLKPKQEGGTIAAIAEQMGDESFKTKFLNEQDTDTRMELLRDFVSTRAVTTMVGSQTSGNTSLINTFGAIFLLADYTKLEDPTSMLRSDSPRYDTLRRTQQLYKSAAEGLDVSLESLDVISRLRLKDKEFVARMATDEEFLVRQTITDLINTAVAEEAFNKYYAYGQTDESLISRANIERDNYIKALSDSNVTGDSGLYFKNEQHREAVRRSLHIDGNRDDFFFTAETARQSLLDITLVRKTFLGMTESDVEFSRKVNRAGSILSQPDINASFAPFVSAQAENLVAIQQWAKRGRIDDPRAMTTFEIGSSARLFDAIDQVHQNLTEEFGSLENALSKQQIYAAYSQMAELAGVFDISREDSNILSLALQTRVDGRQSIFSELANYNAGLAYMQERINQQQDIISKGTLSNADEGRLNTLYADLEAFATGLDANDNQNEAFRAKVREIGEFQRTLKMDQAQQRKATYANIVNTKIHTPTSLDVTGYGFNNTLELFAAPIIGAALMQGGLDERLISGTYDLLQGLSTVEGLAGNVRALEADRLFRLARFKEQMLQGESLLLGATQALAAETFFMGTASLIASKLRSPNSPAPNSPNNRQSGLSGIMAEAVVTAAALAFTRRDNRYGIDREPYRNLAAEALLQTAEAIESSTSEWLERAMDIQVETEDQIVTFDFDPSIAPSSYEERIVTGWIEMSVEGDSDEFANAYYETGNYIDG
jgi:hypothetical protein